MRTTTKFKVAALSDIPICVIRDAILSLIALSGYLYYTYKFGGPDLGNNDFYKYREMVEHPLDLSAAPAPFVLRQIPTAAAYLIYKLGIFYDTRTTLDLIIPADASTKRIFFALIMSNAIAVGLSFVVSLHYLRRTTDKSDVIFCFSYIGIMLSYFYFPFSVIAPLTTGWGWLVTAILSIALLDRRLSLLALGCVTALLARETVLIFMLVFSFLAWTSFARRERYFVIAMIMLAASCIVLILARIYLVHGYEQQIDLHAVVRNLLSFIPSREFVFQGLLPVAIVLMLLFLIGISHSSYAVVLFISMLAIVVVGIATGETSGGIGRTVGETLPLYAIVLLLARLGGLPHSQAFRLSSR
jgi:hypothetical protein